MLTYINKKTYKIVSKKFGISKNILYLCIIIIEPEGIEIKELKYFYQSLYFLIAP